MRRGVKNLRVPSRQKLSAKRKPHCCGNINRPRVRWARSRNPVCTWFEPTRATFMRLSLLWLIVFSAAMSAGTVRSSTEPARRDPATSQSETVVLVGRVQQIYSPRLLTVENRLADERRMLVLLPERSSPPPPAGTVVYARGVLRRLEEAQVGERAWSAVDTHARSEFASRPVLVAESLEIPFESMTAVSRPAAASPRARRLPQRDLRSSLGDHKPDQ